MSSISSVCSLRGVRRDESDAEKSEIILRKTYCGSVRAKKKRGRPRGLPRRDEQEKRRNPANRQGLACTLWQHKPGGNAVASVAIPLWIARGNSTASPFRERTGWEISSNGQGETWFNSSPGFRESSPGDASESIQYTHSNTVR